jgi:hypothetical protein
MRHRRRDQAAAWGAAAPPEGVRVVEGGGVGQWAKARGGAGIFLNPATHLRRRLGAEGEPRRRVADALARKAVSWPQPDGAASPPGRGKRGACVAGPGRGRGGIPRDDSPAASRVLRDSSAAQTTPGLGALAAGLPPPGAALARAPWGPRQVRARASEQQRPAGLERARGRGGRALQTECVQLCVLRDGRARWAARDALRAEGGARRGGVGNVGMRCSARAHPFPGKPNAWGTCMRALRRPPHVRAFWMEVRPYFDWHLHAFVKRLVGLLPEPYSTCSTGRPAALAGAYALHSPKRTHSLGGARQGEGGGGCVGGACRQRWAAARRGP